ncbi:MAG TPA: DUF4345 family protein [Trichocoleus sp.]
MTDWMTIAPNAAAASLLLLGLLALFFPVSVAAFVGIRPREPEGLSEIRAIFGCFFLGLGVACLWLQSVSVFTALGIGCLAAAVGRALSLVVDRSVSIKNIGGLVSEVAIAALFLSARLGGGF